MSNENPSESTGTKEQSEYCAKQRKTFMDLLLDMHIKERQLSEADIREEVDTFMFEVMHSFLSTYLNWPNSITGQFKFFRNLKVITFYSLYLFPKRLEFINFFKNLIRILNHKLRKLHDFRPLNSTAFGNLKEQHKVVLNKWYSFAEIDIQIFEFANTINSKWKI